MLQMDFFKWPYLIPPCWHSYCHSQHINLSAMRDYNDAWNPHAFRYPPFSTREQWNWQAQPRQVWGNMHVSCCDLVQCKQLLDPAMLFLTIFSHALKVSHILQGVQDKQFSNDGRKILSTAYLKVINLWNTEMGQVLKTLGEGEMFFTAKSSPDDDEQNIHIVHMAGCQDKKVDI